MASSRSGSAKPLYWMPDELRSKLGAPVGKLYTSVETMLSDIDDSNLLVTVGDIVTLDILEGGVTPDLSIVDFMTRRMPIDIVRERFKAYPQEEMFVNNPPGQITKGLWSAIEDGIDNPRGLRIIVEGEEDLASLACIAIAPPGTTVIYGIPNRGASLHRVDDELKQLVNDVLKQMEMK